MKQDEAMQIQLGNSQFIFEGGKWLKVLTCPHCGGELAKQAGSFLSTNKRPEKKKRELRSTSGKPQGFVYLMQSENGYYKIGITQNIETRQNDLNRQFPIHIQVVHSIASNRYRVIENKLHNKFMSKRMEYEWFSLSQEDVNWIMQFKDYELDEYQF